jgi:hypothetical protein
MPSGRQRNLSSFYPGACTRGGEGEQEPSDRRRRRSNRKSRRSPSPVTPVVEEEQDEQEDEAKAVDERE